MQMNYTIKQASALEFLRTFLLGISSKDDVWFSEIYNK